MPMSAVVGVLPDDVASSVARILDVIVLRHVRHG
jgi:hypothetical protein